MKKIISPKVTQLPHSGIRKMFNLAVGYPGVVSFLGDPNFTTPSFIIEEAYNAALRGETHYTHNAGFIELRKVVSEKYKNEQGVEYNPEGEVIINAGATQALFIAISCVVGTGDEVIISDPYFPNYRGDIYLAGGKPIFVPLKEEEGWKLRAEEIEKFITPRTKALIINSPANPTGAVIDSENLKRIASLAQKNDLLVITDETYEKVLYGEEKYQSICSFPGMRDRSVVINTCSKVFAMTGWRVGYTLGNKEIIGQMIKLQEYIAVCANSFAQKAAVVALQKGDEAAGEMLREYKSRRSVILEEIEKTPGLSCLPPEGGFYTYINVNGLGSDSWIVATTWLERAGILTVPGSAFSEHDVGYIRFAFSPPEETIKQAFRKIRQIREYR